MFFRLFAVCGEWWSGGGDGFEVEFAAGQVDHGGEVVRVAEAAGPSLHVPDDAVGVLEDGVGVRVLEVCDDLGEVAADRTGRLVLGPQAFWSQHVNSFAEVLLPRHMGGDSMVNPPQRLGYKRFGNDMLLDFYKAERDAIEAICPGKPWYMMEHSTSAVQWKPLNTRKRAGELWELDGVPAITSHPPTAKAPPSTWAATLAATTSPTCSKNSTQQPHPTKGLPTKGRVGGEINAATTTAAAATHDPRILHTIRQSSDGTIRFDFYLNRSKQPVAVNGIEGEPIIACRCEPGLDDFTAGNAGTTGYGLVRNAILITKTTL